MTDRKYGIETLRLHAGAQPDAATGARALPIHQTTSFVFDSAEPAASLFNLPTFGGCGFTMNPRMETLRTFGPVRAQGCLGANGRLQAGAIPAFGIQGGQPAGKDFIDALQSGSHLAGIGDTRTLAIHPASPTHRQPSAADQRAAGVALDMVRPSVGLKTLDDILWDIDQALERRA